MMELTTEETLALPPGFEPAFTGDLEVGDICIIKRYWSNEKYGKDDYDSGENCFMYAVHRIVKGAQEYDYDGSAYNRVDSFIFYDDMDLPLHWSCSRFYPCFIYRP